VPSADDAVPPLPPALAEGLEDFLEALRVEAGLARNTLVAYRGDLESFLRWARERGIAEWAAIEPDLVIDWLSALRLAGAAEASVARRLSALRMALRHRVATGRGERDPTALLASPVLRRALPTTLDVGEVERLLGAPGVDTWQGQRDTALLEVLYACGARISEAVGLRTDGLEPSLRVLRLHGKGSKTRLVPVGERARDALSLWLSDGRASLLARVHAGRPRPEVFLARSGRPLDRTSAWRRVKLAALRAGLPTGVSPHVLRHSFASHLLEGGADLRSVQEMLGHASIRTTEVYTHLDAEHVRGLHRLYHPRG